MSKQNRKINLHTNTEHQSRDYLYSDSQNDESRMSRLDSVSELTSLAGSNQKLISQQ